MLFEYWGHLDVCEELANHKRLFNPPSLFSRLGILVSSSVFLLVYRYVKTQRSHHNLSVQVIHVDKVLLLILDGYCNSGNESVTQCEK